MPQVEINWVEGIEDDFELEKELIKVKTRMTNLVSLNVSKHSDRVLGLPDNIRRVKFGQDRRLFILVDSIAEIIYCLAYLPRKTCYSKKSLNKVLSIVKEISH